MARNRTISPDFWTWEAVIDCAPMTRLLFLGLWTFADDYGVQPLRARTIRMQVFPGDDIDSERVRAMIDELAAQGLVRLYSVEGQDYVAIVDWAIHQRVSRRARRRFPPPGDEQEPLMAPPETVASEDRMVDPVGAVAAPDLHGEREEEPQLWRRKIKDVLRQYWPHHAQIEMMDDAAADRWTAKWIAEGCDFGHDILPAVRDFYTMGPFPSPPTSLQQLDDGVTGYRLRREARERLRVAA